MGHSLCLWRHRIDCQWLWQIAGRTRRKVHLNSEVKEIVTEGRTVKGFAWQMERCTKPMQWSRTPTWRGLSEPAACETAAEKQRPHIKSYKYSMSLLSSILAQRSATTQGGCTSQYHSQRTLSRLAEGYPRGKVAQRLSLYLHMPTITDPSMAPDGGECFYVLSPVPHWARMSMDNQSQALSRCDILLKRITCPTWKRIWLPSTTSTRYISKNTQRYLGSAFSVQPTLLQSAWFRPHNRSEDFDNLYFVERGHIPGGCPVCSRLPKLSMG